jgi:polysaccharide biosynthesis/export protein
MRAGWLQPRMMTIMKRRLKLMLIAAGIAVGVGSITLLLAQPVLSYGAYGARAPRQDDTAGAAQDYDPGASVQATNANAEGTDSENVPGGGMVGPDYVLGPEDVLTITVLNLPEMTQTVRVENDGTVTVKLLGKVKAAGLTALELKGELEKGWGRKYLEDPHVSIFIKQFHSTSVSVIGAVAKPGVYQLPGPRTLIEVIALAGGINMPGTAVGSMAGSAPAGRWIYVTRDKGFPALKPAKGLEIVAPNQVKVDSGLLMYSHETALNIPVMPFDTITVSRAGIVYVVGSVQKPGGFTLEDVDSLTVLQAFSLAQGCNTACNMKHDEIIHTLPDGTRKLTYINLGKIMKAKAPDPMLKANDMLVIRGSFPKGLANTGAGIGFSAISGLLIWRGL